MNWLLFLRALAIVESGCDPHAIGDRNLPDKAHGTYQIREAYLTDVNTIAGTSLTMAQVRANPGIGRWCVVTYVRHYARQPLCYELAARLHSGGPNGWRRRSTDHHWRKMKKQLENR